MGSNPTLSAITFCRQNFIEIARNRTTRKYHENWIAFGSDYKVTTLICDLVSSLLPFVQQHNIALDTLGNLDTLSDRIRAEVSASNTVVSSVALVGIWTHNADEKIKTDCSDPVLLREK